jgi:Ca2+-binding RTX toxin-like protein
MTKRIALVLGTVVALVLVVAAGVAFAAVLTGNQNANTISGTSADDDITGAAGNDTLRGRAGNDTMFGDSGDDDMNGNAGTDHLQGGTGINTVNGGLGDADIVSVVDGDSDDIAIGGAGNNDTCIVDGFGVPSPDPADPSCENVIETQF